ncbi:Cell cycle serine/threonine-protein kinase cdc5/MSD2 [Blastocladiella emersonii ATCC 22665]|nr:Cell cycle serine/threonine-protein kinase cdc5/MSD2 [Blastocladiella emersonii ATCC 22665]
MGVPRDHDNDCRDGILLAAVLESGSAPTIPALTASGLPREQAPGVVEAMHCNLSLSWHLAHLGGDGTSPRVADAADTAPPIVHTVQCIGLSFMFGLGCQPTNGISGVHFNDDTAMYLDVE